MADDVLMHKPYDKSGSRGRAFQPLLFSRWATAAIFGLIPFALLLDPPPGEPFTWLLVTAIFEWFAWRGLRLGAVVSPSQVVVRGYLWDRTIPRQALTGMTNYPSLVWTGARGQARKTPVHALAYNPRALTAINNESKAQSQRLRQALGFDPQGRKRKRRR